MTYQTQTQPLCHYCGKPIGKRTRTIWFGRTRTQPAGISWQERMEHPVSRTEVQGLLDSGDIVTSVRYADERDQEKHGSRYVDTATVWDGVSYVDQFFCNGDHAKRFGYLMAKSGHCTTAYNQAKRSLAA